MTTRIGIVRVRDEHCEQWDIDTSLKRGLSPFLGKSLVPFEVMQGQAVIPVRQMAVWASFIQSGIKDDAEVEILDASSGNLSLWQYSHLVFFMDSANASETLRLVRSCSEMGIDVAVASGAAEIYRSCSEVPSSVRWLGLDAGESASWLGFEAAPEDELIPSWKATRIGDYCPYFVPVSLAERASGILKARPVEAVMREIRTLSDSGILTAHKKIIFDSPFEDESEAAEVILAMARRLVTEDITWSAWLPSCLDVREIAALRRSGLALAWIGSSMDFGGMMHDGKTRRISPAFVRNLKARGIVVSADIRITDELGLGEFELARSIISAGVDVANPMIDIPRPEQKIFAEKREEGRILSMDWLRYDGTHMTFRPETLNAQIYERAYRKLVREMASNLGIVLRLMKPSLTQIKMWHYSALPFTESSALRFALASSNRRNVLTLTKSTLPMLASVVLVGKY